MASLNKIFNKHTNQTQPNVQTKKQQLEPLAKLYDSYQDNNPQCFEFTNRFFPANQEVANQCKFPLALFFSPFPELSQPQQRISRVPRCIGCKAYMNMYNQFVCNGNNFICSICGKQQMVQQNYFSKLVDSEREDKYQRQQLHKSSYNIFTPEGTFGDSPVQDTFVLMVDVSPAAYESQMLFYAVNVIKEVLGKSELDNQRIMIFTFDDNVHLYELTNNQPQKIILDKNVNYNEIQVKIGTLHQIRPNLFEVLDSLEQISKNNNRVISNFFQAFAVVFEITKHFSPKIFILQANELISKEKFSVEEADPNQNVKKHLVLETVNRRFFNKYISLLLNKHMALSFFIFSRTFKNIRVFADLAKLSNNELFLYNKDTAEHCLKFHYDLYYLLSADYIQQYRLQMNTQPSWMINGVYGNVYRQNNASILKINHLQQKKKVVLTFLMHSNYVIKPQFVMQFVAFYTYKSVRLINITTIVKPVTASIQNLYQSIDYDVLLAVALKTHLSGLRNESCVQVRNRFIRMAAALYAYLRKLNKTQPDDSLLFFEGVLAFLKSNHNNYEAFNNSYLLDAIICERNFLMSCGIDQISLFFRPDLYLLSNMESQRCQISESSEDFNYPCMTSLEFRSIRRGLFLMDCSTQLVLYVSRQVQEQQVYNLLGKNIQQGKTVGFTQQDLNQQNTLIANQVKNLVFQLRSEKYYWYAPLYVIVCRENSIRENNFYLYFANEKYDGFKNFNTDFETFKKVMQDQIQ